MKEATQVAPIQETAPLASLHDMPRLLIEWSSPWEEFRSAIRPALVRSPARLAGEAHTEIFPYRGILAGWACEALLLVAAIILPGKLASMKPYTPLAKPKYDIIYFSGEELPQTQDAGGAQTGKSGRAGGHEGFHRTQTLRVARGDRQTDKVVDAPMLNLPKSNDPVANLLAINRVPGPPPASGLRSSLPAVPQAAPVAPPADALNRPIQAVPSMRTPIIAPPPDVASERLRGVPSTASGVVAPPPTVHGDVAAARVPDARVSNVAPPPVSAPVNTASIASRLSLPEATVVAPAPGRVTNDVSSRPGTEAPDMGGQVIAPPPQVAGSITSRSAMGTNGGGGSEVVPPPAQVGDQLSGSRLARGSGGGGNADVVPPPAQVGGSFSGRPGGTLTASNDVVPPAPTVGGGSSLTGRGRGNSGSGLGGALDTGSVAGPPKGGGGTNGDKAGVVISGRPGSKLGVPGSGGNGSIAMSPAGGDKPGIGGSGGGNGIGRGNGPGSGLEGEGSGAAKTGTGRGSEALAKGGISPYPGTGGAGTGSSANPAAPGISVRGGSTVTLPSFGGAGSPADAPGRSRVGSNRKGPGITIEASPHSGGAFNFYGALKGDKVYTIYIETVAGPAVLQYADPTSVKRSYAQELSAPEPVRADMPAGLAHSRIVIACVLDRSGVLRNLHVLEPGPTEMNSKVLAALPNWKFRPAERGEDPVEVNAILGFNIDTR
jgi:hypothetical protein